MTGRGGCSRCTCFHLYLYLLAGSHYYSNNNNNTAGKPFGLPGRSSGMQAQVWANVYRLRNVARATGGRGGGNPLSADGVIQQLSRFKGRLGRDEKRKKRHTDAHLKRWSAYSVCRHGDTVWVERTLHRAWMAAKLSRRKEKKGVPWLSVRTGRLTLSSRNSKDVDSWMSCKLKACLCLWRKGRVGF